MNPWKTSPPSSYNSTIVTVTMQQLGAEVEIMILRFWKKWVLVNQPEEDIAHAGGYTSSRSCTTTGHKGQQAASALIHTCVCHKTPSRVTSIHHKK